MSALDELVNAKNWNESSMFWQGVGYPADVAENAAAELVELRATLKEMYRLLAQADSENTAAIYGGDGAWSFNSTLGKEIGTCLEKYEETP
jgi:hypothetical protein